MDTSIPLGEKKSAFDVEIPFWGPSPSDWEEEAFPHPRNRGAPGKRKGRIVLISVRRVDPIPSGGKKAIVITVLQGQKNVRMDKNNFYRGGKEKFSPL